LKLYLGEDLSPRVASLLRERGLDATGAHEVGQVGLGDLEQLRFAAREGRCLVTRNVSDFLELVRQLVNRQEVHAGIILVPASFRGDEFAILADSIARCVSAFPQGLANQVLFLKIGPVGLGLGITHQVGSDDPPRAARMLAQVARAGARGRGLRRAGSGRVRGPS
jgi:hypothetical protein